MRVSGGKAIADGVLGRGVYGVADALRLINPDRTFSRAARGFTSTMRAAPSAWRIGTHLAQRDLRQFSVSA